MTDRRGRFDDFDDLPSQGDAPLVWDPDGRRFVSAPNQRRQWYVPAPPAGTATRSRPAAPARPRPAPPPPSPGAPSPLPRRGRRHRRPVALVALLVPVVLLAGGLLWGLWLWSRIDRVDVGGALSAGGTGTNYLLVGSDSRERLDDDDPALGGERVAGQRADTIMLLHVGDGPALLMSIPRDLYLSVPGGGRARVNAAYNEGPQRLVETVQQGLGVPVHRYVEIDFVSFGGLVDAVGGVTIDFPHPASDPMSGLDVDQRGPVTLDGDQALAYVRSRTYTEEVDGRSRVDPTGDLGRVQRQQAFLRALLAAVAAERHPLRLAQMGGAVAGGLGVDQEMGLLDALGLAWAVRGATVESVTLPTTPARVGGAAVLRLVEQEAGPVLARFQ